MEYASGQHSCLSYLWLDLLDHHLLQTVLLILPQLVQGDSKSSSFLLPEARERWAERAAASSKSTLSMMVFAPLSVRMQNEINLEHSYRNEDAASPEWNLEWNWVEFTTRILVLRWATLAAHIEQYFNIQIYLFSQVKVLTRLLTKAQRYAWKRAFSSWIMRNVRSYCCQVSVFNKALGKQLKQYMLLCLKYYIWVRRKYFSVWRSATWQ